MKTTDLKELEEFVDSYFGNARTFSQELSKTIYLLHYVDNESCSPEEVRFAAFLINTICELVNEANTE